MFEEEDDELASFPEVWKSIKDIHAMYTSVDWWYTWWIWTSSVFTGISGLIGFAVAGVFLQKFVQDFVQIGSLTKTTVALAVGAAIIYGIVSIAVTLYGNLRTEYFREEIKRRLDERQIQTLLSLDLGRLWDPKFVALKDKFGWRGTEAHVSVVQGLQSVIGSSVGVIAGLGILLAFDPILILITLVPIVPSIIELIKSDERRRAKWRELRLPMHLKDAYRHVLTEEKSVVQSKLVQSTDYIWKKYRTLLDIAVKAEKDLDWIDAKSQSLTRGVALACYTVALAFLGLRMTNGAFSLTEVFLIAGSIRTASGSLASFSSQLTQMKIYGMNYRYFVEYLNAKPLIDETGAGEIILSAPPRIEAEALSFRYPTQNGLALNQCSFSIQPREKVAIVGRNGSGKTTVVRMLSKVFLPEGEVRFNETSMREITQKSLLRHVMYVTQEAELPELYLRDIIAACDPEQVNHERLRHAASFVDFTRVLESLPLRLETMLDPSWPSGIDLSGGQRQRLKLVAAFYRLLDPQVHVGIFDEPMSNCDPETRELFYSALKMLTNKSIVVVAHDPLYLHHFERVIVMDKGRVIQDLRGRDQIDAYRNELALSLSDDLFSE